MISLYNLNIKRYRQKCHQKIILTIIEIIEITKYGFAKPTHWNIM